MEPPKITSTKTISVKQEPKISSSLPSGNNNGKVLTTEKVKKEAEKRPADKVRVYFNLVKKKLNKSVIYRQKHLETFFNHLLKSSSTNI